jgi:quinol monooxygenase YgiN
MFERYTERARRVLFFGRYEAVQRGDASIETEDLLLGLIREGKGLTSRLFAKAGLTYDGARQQLEVRSNVDAKTPASVEIPFSAATKRVLQFAADEADRLLHNYIGTEHLLLGLLREESSVAASILGEKGMQLENVRAEIRELLRASAEPTSNHHVINREFLAGRAHTPMVVRPHIVLVQLTVRPEMLEEFQTALLHNARESLAKDPGCLRFDVSQHADDPQRWILHEVYTDAEAHAAHRQAPHFVAYNEVAERAVLEKTVVKGVGRHLT